MNDDADFDERFRRRLQSGVDPVSDSGHRLDGLRPRFERARRRRQQMIAGAATGAASVAVVVALVVGGGSSGDEQRVDIAGDSRPANSRMTSTSSTTTSTAVPTTTVADTTTSAPAPTATNDAGPGPAPSSSVPGPPPAPTPTTPTTAAPIVPPTASTPVGGTQNVTSEGGSATVTWTATTLLVDALTPAAGWEPGEVERKTPTRVVIHFRRIGGGSGQGSGEDTIDVRVVDGRLESN